MENGCTSCIWYLAEEVWSGEVTEAAGSVLSLFFCSLSPHFLVHDLAIVISVQSWHLGALNRRTNKLSTDDRNLQCSWKLFALSCWCPWPPTRIRTIKYRDFVWLKPWKPSLQPAVFAEKSTFAHLQWQQNAVTEARNRRNQSRRCEMSMCTHQVLLGQGNGLICISHSWLPTLKHILLFDGTRASPHITVIKWGALLYKRFEVWHIYYLIEGCSQVWERQRILNKRFSY